MAIASLLSRLHMISKKCFNILNLIYSENIYILQKSNSYDIRVRIFAIMRAQRQRNNCEQINKV